MWIDVAMLVFFFCAGSIAGAMFQQHYDQARIDLLCRKLTEQTRELGSYKYGRGDERFC